MFKLFPALLYCENAVVIWLRLDVGPVVVLLPRPAGSLSIYNVWTVFIYLLDEPISIWYSNVAPVKVLELLINTLQENVCPASFINPVSMCKIQPVWKAPAGIFKERYFGAGKPDKRVDQFK